MKKSLFLVVLLQFTALAIWAQNTGYKISGYILGMDNKPVADATIDLINAESRTIQTAYSDTEGYYELVNVATGDYTVVYYHFEYEELRKTVRVDNADASLNSTSFIKKSGETLEGVKITSDRLAVQQKDDTTQYDAGMFKTNPDATAEDLIRKMPGMDLSSGTPKTQGEQVKKVLVDGKPFFGEDPSAALKNLPAEVIDKVQVYDEKSEQSQFSGFDDGNTSKTINIMTKKDKRQGVFGKVYAGGGLDMPDNGVDNQFRYSNGGVVNFFKGNRRITLTALNNNINQQDFTSQDLVGGSNSGGRRGGGADGRGGGNSMSSFSDNSGQGINVTNALGLNYSDIWKEKVEVSASYMFNNTNNNTSQDINRLYVLPEQVGQTYSEKTESSSTNYNHRLDARLKWTIDSSNMLLLMPNISYQNNQNSSSSFGQTLFENNFLNNSTNNSTSNSEGLSAKMRALFSHKFKKQGRTFSVWLDGGYNGNNRENTLYALNTYLEETLNDTLDQNATQTKGDYSINTHLSYTEPISQYSAMQLRYKLGYNFNNSDKRTYDIDPDNSANQSLDSLLSNSYKSDYTTQGGELSYRYKKGGLNLNTGLELQQAVLTGQRTLPSDDVFRRSFINLLPSARIHYSISKSQNFRMYFRGYTRNPSVDQLQDVIDNSNPLQLSSGNSDLDQSVYYMLHSMYSATSAKNNSTFFAGLRANIVDDYIGNSTLVAREDMQLDGFTLAQGSQYSRPVNIDGYKSLNAFVSYGQLVSPIKTNMNITLSGNYTVTPGLINDRKNEARTLSIGPGIVLSSNISEKIDYTFTTMGSYNKVNNTLNTAANNEYYNQSSRVGINYIFWKDLVFNTTLNHQYYTGLSEGFDQSFFLWSASIGKKLWKNSAEVKVQVYDILGQNAAISRTFTDLYTQDMRTNVLQRYVLLTFTWNLRFFKGNSTEKDMKSEDSFRRQGPPPGMVPH